MKKHISLLFLLFLPVIVFAGSGSKDPGRGFDPKNIDSSMSPAKDFYQFSVGNWLKNNPIPDEWPSWGTFEALYESNSKIVKEILESSATNKNAPKGSIIQKVGDYYYSGMDTVKIEEAGYSPIKPFLKNISEIKSKDEVIKQAAQIHLKISNPFFWIGASVDGKNSKMMIAQISQGGLGLPDRDYYTNNDPRSKEIREKYLQYMQNMFKLIGKNEAAAKKDADKVMEIETRLANASLTKVEMRDPVRNYNKMSFDSLKIIAPDFNWNIFFKELGIKNPVELDINQPGFIKEVSKMVKELPVNNWKPYLTWNVVRGSAAYLSSAFVNEAFNFNGKFLSGAKVLRPRWKRIMGAEDNALGELIGQLYTEKTFPPEAK
jgi:putative endopeptidase